MSLIQAKYFTKDYTVEWGNCNAAPNSNIRCEVVVSVTPEDAGKSVNVFFSVTKPDGTPTTISVMNANLTQSPTIAISSNILPLPLSVGQYKLTYVSVISIYGVIIAQG